MSISEKISKLTAIKTLIEFFLHNFSAWFLASNISHTLHHWHAVRVTFNLCIRQGEQKNKLILKKI
jgi:hypothetical protein